MLANLAFTLLAALLLAAALWWPVRAYARATHDAPRRRGPLIAAALAGVAVIGLYFVVGSPGMAGAAHADRLRALAERDPESYTPEESIAVLADVARRHPRDARPLLYLGRIEAAQGRAEPAMHAFEEALRRDPNSAEAMIDLGRVMAALREGVVTADARALFEAAAKRDPQNPIPFFYQALAAQQEGRGEDARRLWRETQARLPANDPRREMVSRMLEGPQR